MNDQNKRIGFHVVEALLKNKPSDIKKIFVPANRHDIRIQKIIDLASTVGIKVETKKSIKQNPEAWVVSKHAGGFGDFKKFHQSQNKSPTYLIIDNISDPRNLGACLRTAVVSGINAILINKHQCSPITPLVRKISAGASEIATVFLVSNLLNCIKYLLDEGVMVLGTSEHSENIYTDINLNQSLGVIIGCEEKGVRKKTLEACNEICNLSKNDFLNSLNVSVASGVLLFEIARQKKLFIK